MWATWDSAGANVVQTEDNWRLERQYWMGFPVGTGWNPTVWIQLSAANGGESDATMLPVARVTRNGAIVEAPPRWINLPAHSTQRLRYPVGPLVNATWHIVATAQMDYTGEVRESNEANNECHREVTLRRQ
jgi:hypothetical protein